MKITTLLEQNKDIRHWLANLNKGRRHMITGLTGSAKTLLLAAAFRQSQRPMVVVCDQLFRAQQLVDDLQNVVAPDSVFLFPFEEVLAAEMATSSPEFRAQRIQALNALMTGEPRIVVAAVAGIRHYLPVPATWQAAHITITVGDDLDLEATVAQLTRMGYQREQMVGRPGDFAVRGSILDVYPLNLPHPVRIDLFDTEVDSLRTFDETNQRSIANTTTVTISPATTLLASDEVVEQVVTELQKRQREAADEAVTQQVVQLLPGLQAHALTPAHLVLGPQLFPDHNTLVDYLPDDGLVVFDDYARITDYEQELVTDEQEWVNSHPLLPQNERFGVAIRNLEQTNGHYELFVTGLERSVGHLRFSQLVNAQTRPVQRFYGQMPALKAELDRWCHEHQTVVLLVPERERQDKVMATLADFEVAAFKTTPNNVQPGKVQVVVGELATGFEMFSAGVVVLTASELFAKVTHHRAKRATMANTERLKAYTDLKKGDYVVHVNHGIGRYMGMKTMTVDGKHQDYMTIMYRGDDQLFIPVTQLDRVQKYVAADAKPPHINKLGGTEWQKTKRRVAAKVEDIADDLIDLYAERAAKRGFAFSPDDANQREFDDAFPYAETADQLRSIKEVKRDMERERPMDRLLIGDVGYGKTEVALRAAYKAVLDGKQVAFLVPTTVLAQQHYETMKQRFKNFAVSVGVLSRFTTTKGAHHLLADLQTGKLDIIVGTHRLLSKDVHFHDLGLLIIDEEQRFGVKHKERLKQMKATVDVLTLTATPIPRTLNMAMLGVRDLSVIETAPLNRYPIQTYVLEQNYDVIVAGIRRELARGGQVFYLHNRVHDIERVVTELEALVPEARIAAIHGQMPEPQIERILMDFLAGEYDVLVTTTIIETGIDMPNVNTLFVEDADRMGLAQLYQLRGRVGRSSRIAYAYFMYQPNKALSEVSEKRLEAIRDFTELGAGFKIAMRDLSIRGAGNLLGREQHGFIDSVGYDLYTQMLNEAVARKQGHQPERRTNPEINLEIEAYIPADYISDQQQKIEMYKRIRQLTGIDEYREIQDDLIDRFGEYPDAVANLLEVGVLRMNAAAALVTAIDQKDKRITVTFDSAIDHLLTAKQLLQAVAQTHLHAVLDERAGHLGVQFVIQPRMTMTQVLTELQSFMQAVAQVVTVKQSPDQGRNDKNEHD
ncbi:transcription-repair coupling factor [Ligilactobacillus sp. LYQ139]|uniref:transcription-repair coupling factor n=1 Tax=Ligilactobacillus sp. LYQ139 TaxID=3378800 RepID=UPI0038541F71